jgi:hypothetical protein
MLLGPVCQMALYGSAQKNDQEYICVEFAISHILSRLFAGLDTALQRVNIIGVKC